MNNNMQLEISAASVEDAIKEGLSKLNATVDEVDIKVVDEGSKGLFGLFGSKQAKIVMSLKHEYLSDESVKNIVENNLEESEKEEVSSCSCCCSCKSEEKEENAVVEASHDEVTEDIEESTMSDSEKEAIKTKSLDFLTQLTKYMGTDVSISAEFNNDILSIDMKGDEHGILIGRHGDTLDSIQYITRLVATADSDSFVRVLLDSEGYRAKRRESLIRLANRMAYKAVKTGRRVSLEPMNPFERRIIHSELQANDEVTTHSEGEGLRRHLVITPKRK